MKTEGKTNIQVRVDNKVTTKVIKSTHNDNPEETDREITESTHPEEEK